MVSFSKYSGEWLTAATTATQCCLRIAQSSWLTAHSCLLEKRGKGKGDLILLIAVGKFDTQHETVRCPGANADAV